MAQQGRYTPVEALKRLAKLANEGRSQTEIARLCDLDDETVRKYLPPDYRRWPRGRPKGGG